MINVIQIVNNISIMPCVATTRSSVSMLAASSEANVGPVSVSVDASAWNLPRGAAFGA